MPIWGFAGTTKTYVSQYVGKQDFEGVKRIQRKIQILTLFALVLFTHGLVLYPETLVTLVNPDTEILKESADILSFVFGSILIFGLSSVYFQSISGSGNTRVSFFIELVSVFVYLFSAYLFIKVYELDLFWVWIVEYIYFFTMGAMSFVYLKKFNWQKKKI